MVAAHLSTKKIGGGCHAMVKRPQNTGRNTDRIDSIGLSMPHGTLFISHAGTQGWRHVFVSQPVTQGEFENSVGNIGEDSKMTNCEVSFAHRHCTSSVGLSLVFVCDKPPETISYINTVPILKQNEYQNSHSSIKPSSRENKELPSKQGKQHRYQLRQRWSILSNI